MLCGAIIALLANLGCSYEIAKEQDKAPAEESGSTSDMWIFLSSRRADLDDHLQFLLGQYHHMPGKLLPRRVLLIVLARLETPLHDAKAARPGNPDESSAQVEELLRAAGAAGIQAFISIYDPPELLQDALLAASSGTTFCSAALMPWLIFALQPLQDPSRRFRISGAPARSVQTSLSWMNELTEREQQVAQLVSCGYSNEEIAVRLFLSINTVKTHLKQVFRKGSFTRRSQIAHLWAEAAPAVVLSKGNSSTRLLPDNKGVGGQNLEVMPSRYR